MHYSGNYIVLIKIFGERMLHSQPEGAEWTFVWYGKINIFNTDGTGHLIILAWCTPVQP